MDAGSRRRRLAWSAAFAVVFVAGQALLWRAYYAGGGKPLIGDEQSYQEFALAILDGGAWMPSTIWPPLQSLFIAAIYAIAGVHIVVVQIVQTLLLVGCALMLRTLWRRIGGSVAAANTARVSIRNDFIETPRSHRRGRRGINQIDLRPLRPQRCTAATPS